MNYDVMYTNANVITVDPSMPKAKWVAVKDGKIAGVGENEAPVDQAAKVVDLKGKTVLPGLIDSHAHGTTTGWALNSANVVTAGSVQEVLDAMAVVVEKAGDGEDWIFGTGMNILTMKEGRAPTRWELDAISGNHPLAIVYVTLHGIAVNTRAMEMIDIDTNLPGVVRNEKGELTGSYTSDVSSFVALARALGFQDDSKIEKYIRDCADFAASRGVTTLHSLDGRFVDQDKDFYIWLNMKDSLPIHVVNYFQNTDVNLALALGLPQIGGCLTLDGTGFEGTMAIAEPYNHMPDSNGVLYWADDEVYDFVSKAHKAGLQIGMHCLGDRAIEQLLKVYERVINEQGNPKGIHHRIEHFAMCTDNQIKRATALNLIFPMQPIFTYYWDNPDIPGGDTYEYCFGRKRTDAIDPFPKILAAGGTICGGSDSAVTEINPLLGIHAAANAPNPVRRVSLDDAIKMFTINGAIAANEQDIKGSIEVGKLADLTIIDRDPYREQANIPEFKVEMTIVEGKTVYVRS
jgi:predicted amidohydrolase YtcJ